LAVDAAYKRHYRTQDFKCCQVGDAAKKYIGIGDSSRESSFAPMRPLAAFQKGERRQQSTYLIEWRFSGFGGAGAN
jgi:hypothetical protein